MNIEQMSNETLNKRIGMAHNAKAKAEKELKELMSEWQRRHGEDVGTTMEAGGVRVQLNANRRFYANLAAELLPSRIPAEVYESITKTVIDSKEAREVLPPKLYRECMKDFAPKTSIKIQ